MCDVKRDLQTPPPFQTTTFSQTPPWSVKYFMHGRKTFITLHSVIQRRSRPNYSALAGCYSPIQVLCLCWSLRLDHWTLSEPGITIPVTFPAAEMT